MATNVVLEGEYKYKGIMNPTGKPYIPISFGKKLYLNKDTVEAYELITDETRKSAASGIARGLVGGALLGPVGMLAGGLSAKNKKTSESTARRASSNSEVFPYKADFSALSSQAI